MRLVKKVLVAFAKVVDIRADERAGDDFVEVYWDNHERGVAGILYSEFDIS